MGFDRASSSTFNSETSFTDTEDLRLVTPTRKNRMTDAFTTMPFILGKLTDGPVCRSQPCFLRERRYWLSIQTSEHSPLKLRKTPAVVVFVGFDGDRCSPQVLLQTVVFCDILCCIAMPNVARFPDNDVAGLRRSLFMIRIIASVFRAKINASV